MPPLPPAALYFDVAPCLNIEAHFMRQAEAWGCRGADGAELCANLERLFDLEG